MIRFLLLSLLQMRRVVVTQKNINADRKEAKIFSRRTKKYGRDEEYGQTNRSERSPYGPEGDIMTRTGTQLPT